MTTTTGTPETRTEHTMPRALMAFMASMGIPALIAIIGIAVLGWGAIHWLGAIIWGIVATFAFTLFSMMGTAMGMTRSARSAMLERPERGSWTRRMPLSCRFRARG